MAVVTGPNMGGKSTYLRATALTCLMGQLGCRVAAVQAHLPVLDAIFARIGASDQQSAGVSTFMAEMIDSATIIQVRHLVSIEIVTGREMDK